MAVRNDVVVLFIPRTSLVTNDVQFESNSVDKKYFHKRLKNRTCT